LPFSVAVANGVVFVVIFDEELIEPSCRLASFHSMSGKRRIRSDRNDAGRVGGRETGRGDRSGAGMGGGMAGVSLSVDVLSSVGAATTAAFDAPRVGLSV